MDIRRNFLLAVTPCILVALCLIPFFNPRFYAAGLPAPLLIASLVAASVALTLSVIYVRLLAIDAIASLGSLVVTVVVAALEIAWHGANQTGFAAIGIHALQAIVLTLMVCAGLRQIGVWVSNTRSSARNSMAYFSVCVVLWIVVCALSVLWYVCSDFVWMFDYSNYDHLVRQLADVISNQGFLAGFGAVRKSLLTEYNMVSALPLSLLEVALGRQQRIVLIFAIAAFYTGPAVAMFYGLLRGFTGNGRDIAIPTLVAVASLAFFPMIFFSSLYGMVDIGGLVFVALSVGTLFLREQRGERQVSNEIWPYVVGGSQIFFLLVFRRWYVFLVAPLLVVIAFSEGLRGWQAAGGWKKRLLDPLANLIVLGGFILLCLVAFYWQRVLVMATTNYIGAYQAYWQGTYVEYRRAMLYVGVIPALATVLAVTVLLQNAATRRMGLALAFLIVASVFLFTRVQGFGRHHYLLVLPLMAFSVGYTVLRMRMVGRMRGHVAIASLLVGALWAVLSVAQQPKWSHLGTPTMGAMPMYGIAPPKRQDLDALRKMASDLGQYAKAGKGVCVVASGVQFNQSVFFEAAFEFDMDTRRDIQSRYIWLGDVDRRDGPAIYFPKCDYAIVTKPIGTHLSPGEQQVIVYLAQALLSEQGIGSGFRDTGVRYSLDDGYTALLYRKIGEINPPDWQRYLAAVKKN